MGKKEGEEEAAVCLLIADRVVLQLLEKEREEKEEGGCHGK